MNWRKGLLILWLVVSVSWVAVVGGPGLYKWYNDPWRVVSEVPAALLLSTTAAMAGDITGVPRIVDGDTVEIGVTKIRLSGIDAPETDQLCLDSAGERWACGVTSRDRLIEHAGGKSWTCHVTGADRYRRSLATCEVDGHDVNQWMVRNGWALSFVRYSHQYDADERAARNAQDGLWSGAFIAPWDWRSRNKDTTILGGLIVPIDAQKKLLGAASAAEAPDPACTIKANVGQSGCIYHLEGDRWYGKMNMNSSGKRWFCSVQEAEAAGCRAPKS